MILPAVAPFGIVVLAHWWLRRGRHTPGWACYAFGVLYLTPTMFQWDLTTAAPTFWLWLCPLFAVVSSQWSAGSGQSVSRITHRVSRITSRFRTP